MHTVFIAVEAEPLDRVELGEGALVADLLLILEKRGVDITELVIFNEDHDEPLERDHTLRGHDHPVFHAHRCRKVEVSVHYNSRTYHHKFAPAATIAKVTRWAVGKARLGQAEAEEHVLQISGTKIQPPLNAHLGSLAAKKCAVAFDLVRKKLVQG